MLTTARARLSAVPVRLGALPAFPFDLRSAVALIGLADLTWAQSGELPPLPFLTIAASLLPLSFRRRWPCAIFLIVGIALLAGLALGFSDSSFETYGSVLAVYTAYSPASRHP